MSKSRPRQLLFAFAESPQGDDSPGSVDETTSKEPSVPIAESSQRSESTPPASDDTRHLMELVAAPENLASALAKVVSNKGAPGVDRETVQEIGRKAEDLLPRLASALLSETYVPGDIRRVWIPKPGGGQRGLGIPNVVDRVVQQAVLQVLEPIYEPTFHDSSHGFRPGRGAQTAITEAAGYALQGLRYVVDIDLEKFFDKVHHQRLLCRVAQRISDRRVLRVIRLMLKTNVVLPDGARLPTEEGTPQGGPLSPLLSNIVLDELDWELARRGLRFVRYADDCNVYVKSERAGRRVMAALRRFIEGRLRLKVNEAKSAVARAGRRHFLGFCVGINSKGWLSVRLSDRSRRRLAERIRELTPRNFGGSLDTCMRRLSSYLRSWIGYFQLCTSGDRRILADFDAHVRRRLRAIIVVQKKRARHLFRDLRRRGANTGQAVQAAYCRRGPWWQSTSTGVHVAYPNSFFAPSLVSLKEEWHRTRYDWRPLRGRSLEEPDVRSTSPVL